MSELICGDALSELKLMASDSINCVVTSPPYFGLRDYGIAGQIGMEATLPEYVSRLVAVFDEVRRVLKPSGTAWLNLGDSYSGSGRGGNPEDSPHQKQKTNRGCIVGQTARDAATTNGAGDDRLKGFKPKDLIGAPWSVAFALRDAGWWLRQDIVWAKPNPMPESVTDRCTRAHEMIFMLTKSARYYYDQDAIAEQSIGMDRVRDKQNGTTTKHSDGGRFTQKPDKQRGHKRTHAGFNDRWDAMSKDEQCSAMRNKRSVWTVATKPYPGAHFATFPPEIAETCILAGCPRAGVVLDPFGGSGTVAEVALKHGREYVLIDLNPKYVELQKERLARYPILTEALN